MIRFFGIYVLLSADRYCCTVSDILQGYISISITLYTRICNSPVDVNLHTANLQSKLLNITDGRDLLLANLSGVELYDIICFICTSYIVK